MLIEINGKEHILGGVFTLKELIEDKGFDTGKIVVEYNHEIIPAEKWPRINIKDNDRIEILSFVGGG
ncbi:MAG: sulfur carrier protein ThiS [Candidatus Omnitrophota bacterium]